MSTQSPLVLVVGPTAVGKTEIAIQLAEQLSGEIISADSRLFYRGMDIGTAKPTPEQQARVRHHLIDIVNPDQTLSLAVFQTMAREVIADIQRRDKLPFLVGGTGQYIRAVTEGWKPPAVTPDPQLRAELGRMEEERGPDWMYQRLQALDPEAGEKIHARNVRRMVRALEVILTTGRKFSEQQVHGDSPYQLIMIGLRRPRPELYARIDARIEAMFQAGLLDEVRGLLDKGYGPDVPAMSAIGYRESIRALKRECTLDEAKAEMRRATRAYVRRQANWFKETDPGIRWVDAAEAGTPAATAESIRGVLHMMPGSN